MRADRCFGPGATAASVALVPPKPEGRPRTALPVLQGRPRHLEAHLHRLKAAAQASGDAAEWLEDIKGDLITWLESSNGRAEAALRLVLHPQRRLLAASLEPLPTASQPYRLRLMPHPLGPRRAEPILTHKGLAGAWDLGVMAEARVLGADDALLHWPDGSLAETAIAAIALECAGILVVPPPQGRVASLAEQLDLPAWAGTRGLRIEARDIPGSEAHVGQLWCMNALRGIWQAVVL